jgi:hypothetical protein
MQLFPPDDERLSLETCRGGKINTLKKVKSASSWLKTHIPCSLALGLFDPITCSKESSSAVFCVC